MIHPLQEILATANYTINSGSAFLWKCWGPCARFVECETDHGWLSVVVDVKDGTVYEVNVEKRDYSNPRYVWYNPDFRAAYKSEEQSRGISDDDADHIIELEVWSDLIEKSTGIMQGLSFDERVVIEFDCPDDLFLELARLAHKMDITFNQVLEYALKTYMNNSNK